MESIQSLLQQAHALWCQGNEQGMIEYLEKAIHLCRLEHDDKKLIEILNEYSGSLRNVGRYDEAIAAINESLQIFEKNKTYSPQTYATILINLGNTFREKKSYFEAEMYLLKAKEIFQSMGDTSYAYIGLLNNLALLYQDTNNYDAAHKLQLEAVHLLESTEYQVPLAISYNNLYEISKHIKEPSELSPEIYLDKAAYILQREVGTSHPMYAAVLNNRADYEINQHHYDEALQLYREALPIVKHNYGIESQAYKSVQQNLEYVKDLIETLQQSSKPFRKTGLELGRELSHYVAQDVELNLPDISPYICLALVGTGSECLGYDDAVSEDHDFTKRCQLFLPDEIYKSYKDKLISYFTNYSQGLVQLESISQFYKRYTLYPEGPQSPAEYRRIPQDLLCTATNGEVFLDNLGTFTNIRQRLLTYYPEDIRLRKIAYELNQLAQSGQYNLPRMLQRGDTVAAQLALSQFVNHYMLAVHLLNKSYAPFYKWIYRHTCNLPILGNTVKYGIPDVLNSSLNDTKHHIDHLCNALIQELQSHALSNSSIDFLTYQAKEVMQRIQDQALRTEDSWVE